MPRFFMDSSNDDSYLDDAARVVLDRAIATTQVLADWDLHLELVRQLVADGHLPKKAAMMATEYQKEKTGVDVSESHFWWNAYVYVTPPPVRWAGEKIGRVSGTCWDNLPLIGQDQNGVRFVWVRVGEKFIKYTMLNQHPWLDLVRDVWEIYVVENLDFTLLAPLRQWGLLAPDDREHVRATYERRMEIRRRRRW